VRYEVNECTAARSRLDVWVNRPARRPISRYLFGKFTEHLGQNVYNGIWAQILRNPGFEAAGKFGPERLDRLLARAEQQFRVEGLRAGTEQGVAPYWMPWGRGGEYALDVNAFNSDHCQRIRRAARGGSAGVEQPIFLPLHRVREFEFSLWARSRRAHRLSVSIVRDGKVVSRVTVGGLGANWAKHTARLKVNAPRAQRGTVFRLRISFSGPGPVWLDQAFLFPADHVDGFDPDVIRLWREAKLPLLRFPGGNFVSGYHWKDGVGPVERRPTKLNPAWAGAEYNHVGTDEMMALCRAIGCEPLICVNAGNGTAPEAAEWVEYCNGSVDTRYGARRALNGRPEPYNVRFWEIGNELYGKWQIGCCGATEYAKRYGEFTRAMRSVDPGIRFIANGHEADWNAEVVRRNGATVRSLSTHPLIGGAVSAEAEPDDVFRALMGYTHVYPRILRRLALPMRRAGLTPRIAVTELQVFVHIPTLPNNRTVTEALWTASMLNAAIRSGGLVELVTHSALVNHGGCVLKQCEFVWPEPVYFTHKLYGTQTGVLPLHVNYSGPCHRAPHVPGVPRVQQVPELDAVALANGRGDEVTLIVVNRRPRGGLRVPIALHGFARAPVVRVRELTGRSFMAANTFEKPDKVRLRSRTVRAKGSRLVHTFPPHSLTQLVFRAAR